MAISYRKFVEAIGNTVTFRYRRRYHDRLEQDQAHTAQKLAVLDRRTDRIISQSADWHDFSGGQSRFNPQPAPRLRQFRSERAIRDRQTTLNKEIRDHPGFQAWNGTATAGLTIMRPRRTSTFNGQVALARVVPR
jgi:hypothetical protein